MTECQTLETWTCYRCIMKFRIEDSPKSERHRCPECGVSFWSAKLPTASPGNGKIRIGIAPAKVPKGAHFQ